MKVRKGLRIGEVLRVYKNHYYIVWSNGGQSKELKKDVRRIPNFFTRK